MAKHLITDEDSALKRQSRRRLIGAVALTTVVVIALPMIFDNEPVIKKTNDIELLIPDKDNAGEFRPHAGLPEVDAVSSVANSNIFPESEVMGVPATVGSIVKPVVQNDTRKIVPTKPLALQHPTESKTKVDPKKVDVKIVEAKSVAKSGAIPVSGFVVQVGAFANASAAKGLQEKLNKQGFHTYTENIGDKVRVRVGSYPNREDAEKARHKLESFGLHPNVINLG
jgi:DedD protein